MIALVDGSNLSVGCLCRVVWSTAMKQKCVEGMVTATHRKGGHEYDHHYTLIILSQGLANFSRISRERDGFQAIQVKNLSASATF